MKNSKINCILIWWNDKSQQSNYTHSGTCKSQVPYSFKTNSANIYDYTKFNNERYDNYVTSISATPRWPQYYISLKSLKVFFGVNNLFENSVLWLLIFKHHRKPQTQNAFNKRKLCVFSIYSDTDILMLYTSTIMYIEVKWFPFTSFFLQKKWKSAVG